MTQPMEAIVEDKIIHYPPFAFTINPKGYGYELFEHMSKYKERIAQIDGITGEEDSYGSLLQRCIRTSITLEEKGVNSNDIVMVCSDNHLNTYVPYLASLFIGARISGLDQNLSAREIASLLKQVTPKVIFTTVTALELIEEAIKDVCDDAEIIVFQNIDKHTNFSEFLLPKPNEDQFKPTPAKSLFDTAMIFFSSGTTGFSKGICINHYSMLGQVLNTIRYGFIFDRSIFWSSVYWTTSPFLIGCLYFTGGARIMLPNYNLAHVYNAIEKYEPTTIMAVTSQLYEIARDLPKDIDVSSVKQILFGGVTSIEKHVLTALEAFPNAKLYCGFGQTETVMFITACKPSDYSHITSKRPTTCGRGVPGMSYKVVDPETETVLGPNQPGELRLKTKYVCNGYHKQDSSSIWTDDGWYKTGDVVYYDEDLYFFHVDRVKEMFKYRVWHIQPAVVESILLTHPAVRQAVVIGIPDELDGERPMGLIVLNPRFEDTTTDEITRYVDDKVEDKFKLRGGLKLIKEIPTNATGKIQRRNIKNMVLRGEL